MGSLRRRSVCYVGWVRVCGIAALLIALLACGPSASSPAPSSSSGATATTPDPTVEAIPSTEPTPSPAITGLSGRVVFTRAGGRFEDETLFVANIDGSDERQLSDFGETCCPWALADGSLLVRSGRAEDGRIAPVFSGLDGSDERVFPLPEGLQFGSGPLSPDGTRVVLEGFTVPEFEGSSTYIADIDGSHLEVLTEDHFIPSDFSPDGRSVLLFDNPESAEGPPPPGSLWLVDVDGSNLRQLTPDDTSVQCCSNSRFSPDGARIVFASPDGGLWTIAPDGSGLTEVFHEPGKWAITATWSPDGSMLLFGLDPSPDPFSHPPNGLYVTRGDGSDLTLVIGGNDFKREPIWLPPAS